MVDSLGKQRCCQGHYLFCKENAAPYEPGREPHIVKIVQPRIAGYRVLCFPFVHLLYGLVGN